MRRRETTGSVHLVRNPNLAPNAPLAVQAADPSRVALLLNRNARLVTDKLALSLEHLVGRDNFFYSKSLEEAEAFCRELVQRGYGTIVCGGGDGTMIRAVNLARRYIKEANAWRTERFERYAEPQTLLGAPRFALLPLGTGNGLRRLVGAGDPTEDLRHLIDFAPRRILELPMIEDDSECFVFGGMGYDSVLLNDYDWLKQRTHNPLLKPMMHSVLGYFAALLSRTLPRVLAGKNPPVEARIVTDEMAYYVDPRRGDRVAEVAAGTVLFDGLASNIAMSTSSFYGYNFKMFPFAGLLPGYMQLRVAQIGALRCLAHLPGLWLGHYRNPKLIFDFLVKKIRIELCTAYPFQHSGDDKGPRDHLNLRIAEDTLKLVDFHRSRPF